MNTKVIAVLLSGAAISVAGVATRADDDRNPSQLPTNATSNSDGNRRDNSPNSAGEINSGGPVGRRGKISCMDQELAIRGLPLPVR